MSETQSQVRDNIANYYMLPLLRYNKTSFGGLDNFINAYVTVTAEIVVEIKDPTCAGAYYNHKHYVKDYTHDGKTVIVFDIPEAFYDDYQLFIDGKYSHFSLFCKDEILKYSGLPYEEPSTVLPRVNGRPVIITAKKLLALSRAKELRDDLEEQLGTKISLDAELISKPDSNNFYKLPN